MTTFVNSYQLLPSFGFHLPNFCNYCRVIGKHNIGYSAFALPIAANNCAQIFAFPFGFQLMVGVGLHRNGGCAGKPVTGILPALIYIFMNLGAALLTVAILMGFSVSLVVMYPLPVVGVETGQWSYSSLVLGFTGIGLVLIMMILLYVDVLVQVQVPRRQMLNQSKAS